MRLKGIIKEIISTLLWVAVIFGGVKVFYAYVMEPFEVSGRSMDSTLQDGERMFMLKYAKIDRFDVVVFPAPDQDETTAGRKLYIKRVIGLPGDSLAYEGDQLIINGQAVDEPYLAPMQAQTSSDFTYDFSLEAVTGESVVPEGKLFVMGDNRRNSLDGRSFGFIDLDDVIGEADFVHWPLSEMHILSKYELNADGTEIVQR